MKKSSLFAIALTLLLFAGCVVNPVTGKRQFGVASEAKEIAMGASYDPQIVASMGLYESPELQDYINAKGKEMVAVSHRPNLAFDFKIVDSPVVNAFAVPGGYVYFTRGIMAHFNNEAEFAGVLGHEIGHVTARHSVVQQRNQVLGQIGLIAGVVAVPELMNYAQPLTDGMSLMFLKFGRDAESQSDQLGVEYSCEIGYDAHYMGGFFNTLARKSAEAGAGDIPEFLSTHPNPLNRQENVNKLADEWQAKENVTDLKEGRNSYLQMLEGLVYGEDPRQGFVENSMFYHPELKFEFSVPSGWQYQNSPSQFVMAPTDGKAVMYLMLAQGASLTEAQTNFSQSTGLTVLTSQNTNINGMSALLLNVEQAPQANADGTAADQNAARVEGRVALIEYNGLIYNLMGLTMSTDMSYYEPKFNEVIEDFDKLTDSDKLNRQPSRITLVTASQNQSLESVLLGNGIPSDRLEEFAIVNGMYLNDNVQAGTMIKVIK